LWLGVQNTSCLAVGQFRLDSSLPHGRQRRLGFLSSAIGMLAAAKRAVRYVPDC
jgi:hypothetical protein